MARRLFLYGTPPDSLGREEMEETGRWWEGLGGFLALFLRSGLIERMGSDLR